MEHYGDKYGGQTDQYGNPIRQTDEYGNPVRHTGGGTMGEYGGIPYGTTDAGVVGGQHGSSTTTAGGAGLSGALGGGGGQHGSSTTTAGGAGLSGALGGGGGHHVQLHRSGSSSSSSSSEDDGFGGRRKKKGLKEKIKEKMPGGHGGQQATELHHHGQEKKGIMEKIKEKLPGGHH